MTGCRAGHSGSPTLPRVVSAVVADSANAPPAASRPLCAWSLSLAVILTLVGTAAPGPAAQPSEPGCREARSELDRAAFLTGDWQVEVRERSGGGPDDWSERTGRSVVRWDVERCVLVEELTLDGEARRYSELRVLAYDRRSGEWDLAIVDSEHGNILTMTGRSVARGLVFTSAQVRRGRALLDRVRLERAGAEEMEFRGESSFDAGATWETMLVGRYVRAEDGENNDREIDDMIEGVGGAFIFSNDPKRLADWYSEHLGFVFEGDAEFGAFYQIFWAVDPEDSSRRLDTTFSIMQAKVTLPERDPDLEPESMYGDQPFMVNLRVRDLDAVLDYLESKGVAPLDRSDYEYGRFAWVYDADGNRIELYQPIAAGG